MAGNIMMWTIRPEDSVLSPDSNTVFILGGVFVVLMVFALYLAWQEKRKVVQSQVASGAYPQYPLNGIMDKTTANHVNLVYQTGSNSYVTVPYNGVQMLPQPHMGGPPIMY